MGKAPERQTGLESDRSARNNAPWTDPGKLPPVELPADDEIFSEGFRVPRTLVHKIDFQPAPNGRIALPLIAGVVLGVIATTVAVLTIISRPPQVAPGLPRSATVVAKPNPRMPVPETQPVPRIRPVPEAQSVPETQPVRQAQPVPPAAVTRSFVPSTPAPASDLPRGSGADVSSPAGRIEPETVAALMKRGAELIATGDIVSARSMFRYAADASDARAAFALAETYDPTVLGRLGVQGLVPDVANAQFWYDKAMRLGSREAPGRLETLARRTK